MKQKMGFVISTSLTLFFIINPAFAETKMFIKEYTYQASEIDSKVSSRAIALEQVKRLLLEEMGTYLISETEVKNYQLTKDIVTTLSAGIVRTEILNEMWNGDKYYLKARVFVDNTETIMAIERFYKDKGKSKELEE